MGEDYVDWEDLSQEDQTRAQELMSELNKIMDKYMKERDAECEDSILRRLEDETGVSGTGIITEGYQYYGGIVVMKWLTEKSSVAVYSCIEDVEAIHGHGGKTVVEWDTAPVVRSDIPYWAHDPIDYFVDLYEENS